MTAPIYAIGDIHGQLDKLELALTQIESDGGPDAQVVFLGDFVDRGPDSRGVIDLLVTGQAEGRNWITLMGNHDRMFAWFLEDMPRHDPHMLVGYHWLHDRVGGIETLESYGVTFPERTRLEDVHTAAKAAIPEEHVNFLLSLATMHQTDDHAFVHAGIRPGIPLAQQTENDLVWIRQPFHQHAKAHPKLIVHGHTPVDRAQHYGNRVNLDTGAGYGKPLTTAVFEGTSVWVLEPDGRQTLAP
ncbi:metallophosphoesterase family protein [Phaeobacter porticola]|uniref:Putative serine/threonine phosphatase n=1 Tax=Phaeobacter porticola TaxID=1844006 RepID=A0A1L3IA05_9RHOB|nr:metallophosphoesterase family protein [Phaeobacter porticola]APG48872.1 putative serine/threonine phosphatase [Phaeobacter porticola]